MKLSIFEILMGLFICVVFVSLMSMVVYGTLQLRGKMKLSIFEILMGLFICVVFVSLMSMVVYGTLQLMGGVAIINKVKYEQWEEDISMKKARLEARQSKVEKYYWKFEEAMKERMRKFEETHYHEGLYEPAKRR